MSVVVSPSRRSGRSFHSELLESRRLLATIVVTSLADSGAGSLRQAVSDASPGDTLDLTSLAGTITLASQITINKSLTLSGPGRATLAISGNDATRVFHINAISGAVTMSGLTIRDGFASQGAAFLNGAGTLTLDEVDLLENVATHSGGVFQANASSAHVTIESSNVLRNSVTGGFGGVYSGIANLTVRDSTIAYNSATDAGQMLDFMGTPYWEPASANGGAIAHGQGSLLIENSTIAYNTSTAIGQGGRASGAAISTVNSGSRQILNSTIAFNTSSGEVVDAAGVVSGMNVAFSVRNSIIASNTGGPDVAGTFTTLGHNLIGNSGSGSFVHGTSGDMVGSGGAPFDPRFGAFGDHGGTGHTLSLSNDSPAINAADHAAAPTLDQRGNARESTSDIGAFEYLHVPVRLDGSRLSFSGRPGGEVVQVWQRSGDQGIRVRRGDRVWNFPEGAVSDVVIHGNTGDDQISVNLGAVPVTILGSDGNDTLTSGAGNDFIRGGPGNDSIQSMQGEDRIYGDAGNDLIDAGSGRNWVWGGAGDDTITGGNSIDRIWGEAGDDRINGRGGADVLDGGADNDRSDDDPADARNLVEVVG